jgi:hypothetical protein
MCFCCVCLAELKHDSYMKLIVSDVRVYLLKWSQYCKIFPVMYMRWKGSIFKFMDQQKNWVWHKCIQTPNYVAPTVFICRSTNEVVSATRCSRNTRTLSDVSMQFSNWRVYHEPRATADKSLLQRRHATTRNYEVGHLLWMTWCSDEKTCGPRANFTNGKLRSINIYKSIPRSPR